MIKLTKNTDPDKKDLEKILSLIRSRKFKDAEKEVYKKLTIFPNSEILYNIYGASLAGQNKLQLAIEKYKKSIKINPNYPEVYNNLGIALLTINKADEAIINFKNALNLKKNFAEANYGLGRSYFSIGKDEEALNKYYDSIKIKPDYAEVYNSIGLVFYGNFDFKKSSENFKKCLKIKPDYIEAYNNLGNLLSRHGKFDEAILEFKKAIKIKPDYAKAYSNLLLTYNYKSDFDYKIYLQEAKNFRINCKSIEKISTDYSFDQNPKKLKIGCVSADFGNHPGGYFTYSTLEKLSQKNFQLIAYSTNDRNDDLSNKFKNLFSVWHSIKNWEDKKVIQQVLKDGIHILIDMQGPSASNRLPIFFYKPAPIQLTWLGQGSSGISEIDYFLGSPEITPKDEEKHYIEKVLRLPQISQCYTKPNFQIEISELPAIENKFITFGCLNKLSKVNDNVIKLWSNILHSVKQSKILFKSSELSNPQFKKDFLNKLNDLKIKEDRLILLGKSATRKQVLEVYNKIDIALDPFPFQGNTSTCESVWMGVPVLTLKGNRYLFHFGESINYNLNMEDWVAENQDDYLKKAVNFSSDLEKLSFIRKNLRKKALSSPVFDEESFSVSFAEILWSIWKKFRN